MKSVKKYSLKLVTALAAVIVLMMAYTINVYATGEETTQMKVTGDNVNVRSDADSNAQQLTTVSTGQIVTVLGSKNDAGGNTWYNVSFTNSSTGVTYTGYIYGQYLTAYEAPSADPVDPDPNAGGEAGGETTGGTSTDAPNMSGTFTPMEGDGQPSAIPNGFRSVYVRINGTEIPAWTNDAYYIFYAMLESGETTWIIYEQASESYIKYDASFMAGSVKSSEKDEKEKGGSGVAVVILVIVCIILIGYSTFVTIKGINQGGNSYSRRRYRDDDDDDDEDDDYDDDDEDDEDDEDDDEYERKPKKGGFFSKFSKAFDDDDDDDDDEDDDYDDDDEDDEDDDDDFEEPVRKSQSQRSVSVSQPQRTQAQRTVVGGQGNRIVTDSQGRRVVVNAQGQRVVTNPQGQRVVTNAQGQRVVTNAQGQRVVINANGQRVVQAQRKPVSQPQKPVQAPVDEDEFNDYDE